MKKIFYFSISAVILLFIVSACNNSTSKKTQTDTNISYNEAITTIQWTAYKTTDKVGVKGTFNQFEAKNKNIASSIEEIINSTTFKIPTASVYTGNDPRDILIKNYFFGAMMNTDTISGNFSSAKDGKGFVTIKMNNVEYKNEFTYTFVNDSLKINSTLELDNWNGYKALASLHEMCYDKHTGKDGVSKTWSDVDLQIISVFKNEN